MNIIDNSFKTSMSYLLITCMLSLLVGCVFSAVETQFGSEMNGVPGRTKLRTLSEVAAATSGVCVLVLSLFYLCIRLFLHAGSVVLEMAFHCAWIGAEGAVLVAAVVAAFDDELRHLSAFCFVLLTAESLFLRTCAVVLEMAFDCARVVAEGAVRVAAVVAAVVSAIDNELRRFTAFCFVLFAAESRRVFATAAKASSIEPLDLLKAAASKNQATKRPFYKRLAAAKKSALLSATTAPFSKLDRFFIICARLLSEIVASPRTFLVRRKLRGRCVRFASEDFVCPVPRCQMTDTEMEAMYGSKIDNQTRLLAEKLDRSFEDWQSHDEFDTGVRCKLGGSRDFFTEEYFFFNANGELEHPAHWKCFYREIYPFLSKEDFIPGFSSWESYDAYIHLYRDFYETCIMWFGNSSSFKRFGRKRFRFAPEDNLLEFCPVDHMKYMSIREIEARYNTNAQIKKMKRKGRLEHRFEIFRSHKDYDRATFAKLRANTNLTLMEEDFFIDEKGKHRHPAHWERFSHEAFPKVFEGQLPLAPGFSSLEEYEKYMFDYDEFYTSSIQRTVQSAVEEEAEAKADEEDEEIVGAAADNATDENEEVLAIEEAEQPEPLLVSQFSPCPLCGRGPKTRRVKKLKTFGPCNRGRLYLARKCKENVRYSK